MDPALPRGMTGGKRGGSRPAPTHADSVPRGMTGGAHVDNRVAAAFARAHPGRPAVAPTHRGRSMGPARDVGRSGR